MKMYTISEDFKKSTTLVFMKKNNTLDFYVNEFENDKIAELTSNEILALDAYKCSKYTFIKGLDQSIVDLVEKTKSRKPIKIVLSRWYPYTNPITFLSYGQIYVVVSIQYIKDNPILTLEYFKVQDNKRVRTAYTIAGDYKIDLFIKFLKNEI